MSVLRTSLAATLIAVSVSANAQTPSFTFDGKTYAGDTLPGRLQQQFYQMALEQRHKQQQAIDNYVLQTWLEAEAEKAGVSPQEYQKRVFKVEVPTEEELKAFYDQNQARMPAPYEQIKGQIREFLQGQQFQKQVAATLEKLKKEKGYSVTLPEIQPPRFQVKTEGYPFKGAANAPVTLVKFADYQCPHCKDAVPVMDALLKKYEGKLKLVYRDFPINPSGVSRKIAWGAVCADQQGKFWDWHDKAFERQTYLKSITPEMLAKEVGLDATKFKTCYDDPATRQKVAESYAEGNALGITGTPTFFVNGLVVNASHTLEADLSRVIDAELARLNK